MFKATPIVCTATLMLSPSGARSSNLTSKQGSLSLRKLMQRLLRGSLAASFVALLAACEDLAADDGALIDSAESSGEDETDAVLAELTPIQKPGHLQARALGVSACVASPSDQTCNGRDPQSQGCNNDAFRIAEAFDPTNSVKVALRYSPTCRSAWSVATDVRSGSLRTVAQVIRNDGVFFAQSDLASSRSPMVYLGNSAHLARGVGQLLNASFQVIASAQTPFTR